MLYVIDFEHGERARMHKTPFYPPVKGGGATSQQNQGTVFQTVTIIYFINPETSYRVTLAMLAIGFQPKLPTTNNQQPNTKATNNRQPTTNLIFFHKPKINKTK